MNFGPSPQLSPQHDRMTIRKLPAARPVPDVADDVRTGLCSLPKTLPPKYFYDEYGSWLFDQICKTPEYYPTRIEDALLADKSNLIIERVQPDSIIELGSGASRKTTHLLDACWRWDCQARYQPVDVCDSILLEAGNRLLPQYPWLEIEALVGDYGSGLHHLPVDNGSVRLFVFLGGTIGNFNHDEAVMFLRDVRAAMNDRDWFLIGADRVKETEVLNAAYNDAQGYTAAFNLNMLNVINRELGADFALDEFSHRAWYNEEQARVEMHLHAMEEQTVHIRDLAMDISFSKNESIRTEISRKFTPETLTSLVRRAGFTVDRHFEPKNGYFSLALLRPSNSSRKDILQ